MDCSLEYIISVIIRLPLKVIGVHNSSVNFNHHSSYSKRTLILFLEELLKESSYNAGLLQMISAAENENSH